MNERLFFLVAGPAGVGKSTLLSRLVAEETGLVKAVSVTTRPPRAGESDGVAYHFWDEVRFEEGVARGDFLEHARVHGNRYGTLARFVVEQLNAGQDVIKDIDVQGVEQIRRLDELRERAVSIFILPPAHDELVRRLRERSSESAESFQTRLKTAEEELKRAGEFDYAVVNGDLATALGQLKAIRAAEHCRTRRN